MTSNMQQLVNLASGKEVWVALVPPVFNLDGTPDTTRNGRIVQYNTVILSSLTGRRVGPDFYSFFLNRFSLFADELHPNGYGHALMANLWKNALVGLRPDSGLPLILENITRTSYKQNLLGVGDTCYVEQLFTLVSVPSALQNGVWVMTAHADRTNATQSLLSFNVGLGPTTVFVAYQSGVTPPTWIAGRGFLPTSLQITVNTGRWTDQV